MSVMFSKPEEIYTAVIAEVDKLIRSFNSHSGSEEIKKAQSEARDRLGKLQEEIKGHLNELQKNSEWDVLTLAFYGETNAGKSTIIETLRILLNEPKKVKEREEFKGASAEYSRLQKEIEICQSKANIAELQERVKLCKKELISNADGKIIGDGRSDFTRTVTSYEFEANNQKFALLDLPGIEGNERLVLDAINSAVQKAHAVFYITEKPTPPQTGDKNSEGTIEKIKKHLKQQTEVYAIFNKRAKNPNSLKDVLIDSDEAESLKVLDKTMRSHLGEQYRESISVSAYPAFLAVGNCWGDDYLPKKEKFLEHFKTPEEILDKSCVQTFVNWLTGDMVHNSKEKIKKSNYKKAAVVLEHAIEESGNIRRELLEFNEYSKKLNRSANDQLDNAAGGLKDALQRETHTAIGKFKSDVRREIYAEINSGMENEVYKSILEEITKEGVRELQNYLEESFENQINEFQGKVSGIVRKYQNNASELLITYSDVGNFDAELDLNIHIENDINWGGFAASLGVMLLVPGVAFVLPLLGVAKSLGFFDGKKIKAQQRKHADEVLEKYGEDISKSIEQNLRDSDESLKTSIENIRNELMKPINHIKELNRILERTIKEFETMTKAITQKGDR